MKKIVFLILLITASLSAQVQIGKGVQVGSGASLPISVPVIGSDGSGAGIPATATGVAGLFTGTGPCFLKNDGTCGAGTSVCAEGTCLVNSPTGSQTISQPLQTGITFFTGNNPIGLLAQGEADTDVAGGTTPGVAQDILYLNWGHFLDNGNISAGSPGPYANGWITGKGFEVDMRALVGGISQAISVLPNFYKVGDSAYAYFGDATGFTYGGYVDQSGEGVAGINVNGTEFFGFCAGSIVSTTGTGDTAPTVNCNGGGNQSALGTGMYIMDTSKPVLTGNFAGSISSLWESNPLGIGVLPVTGSPSPTTGICITATTIPSSTVLGAFQPKQVVCQTHDALQITTGSAWIASNIHPEQVNVTAVSSSGTVLTITSVAPSTPGPYTLTSAGAASGGNTVYTGTITGGASNAYAGRVFTVSGFDLTANNGIFFCTTSTATTLTLNNASGVVDTHAAVAQDNNPVAVYTGTITGGGSSAFLGQGFTIAGFVADAENNGTFIATASSGTTLTLDNDVAISETHAATATTEQTLTINGWNAHTGSYIFQGGTQGLMAGADDSSKSQVFTDILVLGATGSDLIIAIPSAAGLDAVGYPGFGVEAQTTTSGYTVYPGAMVISNQINGITPTLELNTVPWANGDNFANPPRMAYTETLLNLVSTQDAIDNGSFAGAGVRVIYKGNNASFVRPAFAFFNQVPVANYLANGGWLLPPPILQTHGATGSVLEIEDPLQFSNGVQPCGNSYIICNRNDSHNTGSTGIYADGNDNNATIIEDRPNNSFDFGSGVNATYLAAQSTVVFLGLDTVPKPNQGAMEFSTATNASDFLSFGPNSSTFGGISLIQATSTGTKQYAQVTDPSTGTTGWGCTGSGISTCTTQITRAGGIIGPAVAPTGSCPVNGAWEFTQDGHASVCLSGSWSLKI